MEQTAKFDLELALKHYLNTLNSNGILSEMDQDELLDHMYSEIEVLENSGLSTEEALIISQKRLGDAKVIKSEYHKAKPWARIIQFLTSSTILLFGIFLIINLAGIISYSAIFIMHEFEMVDLAWYVKWGDSGIQIACLIISFSLGLYLLKETLSTKLKNLWVIPFSYFISVIGKMIIMAFLAETTNPESMGRFVLNSQFIELGLLSIGLCVLTGIIFKYRNLKLQFD